MGKIKKYRENTKTIELVWDGGEYVLEHKSSPVEKAKSGLETLFWIAVFIGATLTTTPQKTIVENQIAVAPNPIQQTELKRRSARGIASIEQVNDSFAEQIIRSKSKMGAREMKCYNGDAFACYSLAKHFQFMADKARHFRFLQQACLLSQNQNPHAQPACKEWENTLLSDSDLLQTASEIL